MLICYLISLIFLGEFIDADDVLGCNGFVKSDVNIDLSKVSVKLFTKQGSLKDQTECAPTNGYYFIPLYDHGDYVIKVSTPSSWSFDPPEVAISVDGVNDPCSQGKDINFVFNGFAISGSVVSAGHKVGPAGVKVSLHESSSTTPALKSAVTDASGHFIFSSIKPGSYLVKATHPKWIFGKHEVKVVVKDSNGVIEVGSLNILGYDVSGSATSDNQPIAGVTFALYGKNKVKGVGCDEAPLSGITAPKGHYICHVTSDASGKFMFPQLPPNDYTLVPQSGTKFNISPTKLEFTVAHNSVTLPTSFQVQGFSVSGKVRWSKDGPPLAGAKVILNDKVVAVTDETGSYTLDSMRTTNNKLHFQAGGVEFNVVDVASSKIVSDVFPARYKVSGKVMPHNAKVFVAGGSEFKVDTASGQFFGYLPPGQYSISARSAADSSVQYSPRERKVTVKDQIIENIDFAELKSIVTGEIVCLEACPDINILLESTNGVKHKTTAKGGKYSFNTVLPPGEYAISIENDNEWCWNSKSIKFSITSEKTEAPQFVQKGYILQIISSHSTKVEYETDESSKVKHKDEIKVNGGNTRACVPNPGPYILTPVGCHLYKERSFQWTAGSPPVELKAVAHTYEFGLMTDTVTNDLEMKMSSPDAPSYQVPSTGEKKSKGNAVVLYEIKLQEGQVVELTPSSFSLQFSPETVKVTGKNDCVIASLEEPLFKAKLGKVLEGYVMTAGKGLEGVKLSVVSTNGKVVASLVSTATGMYKSPPIGKHQEYKVTAAEKEGYVITGPDAKGNFHAHKLAEITVKVTDQAGGVPLQGVLLSLSGAERYRRNAQTSEEGVLSFLSLSPGEYFLRPMMKEYQFTPSSQTISVKEGETTFINISGRRVAYSGIGVVSSLNGDGEQGIVVEAVGLGNCSLLQEEATSSNNGQFRIRGLQSWCEYTVRVKKGPEINRHIFKSSPDGIPIKVLGADVKGLELYAFRSIGKTDILAYVAVERPDDMKTLRVVVTREGSNDGPVSSSRLSEYKTSGGYSLSSIIVAMPSVPSDGAGYVVSLESTLPRATHDYALRPVRITADAPVRVARLSFAPVPRQRQPDVGSPSTLSLSLTVLALIGYFYRKNIVNLLTSLSQGKSDDSSSSSFADKRKQKLKKM